VTLEMRSRPTSRIGWQPWRSCANYGWGIPKRSRCLALTTKANTSPGRRIVASPTCTSPTQS